MQVLVDTSVWSIALRKQSVEVKLQPYVQELANLIADSRIAMIGLIRQKLLSGIKSSQQFQQLKTYLQPFSDLALVTADFELAAELFNHCRSHGVQGSHIDFLITAVAVNYEIPVFTLDDDFKFYAKYTSLKLHHLSF